MTSRPVPGAVRAAAIALGALAFIGVALIVVAALEIAWWRSADAAALEALFARVKETYGLNRPVMMRGVGEAQLLIACGAGALALAGLAVPVLTGRQWARTTAVTLMLVLVVVTAVDIGSSVIATTSPETYMAELGRFDPQGRVVPVADVRAVLYPGWYTWLEDIAQGALVLACVTGLIALGGAAVWSEGFFKSGADASARDAWGAKLAEIREENRRGDE